MKTIEYGRTCLKRNSFDWLTGETRFRSIETNFINELELAKYSQISEHDASPIKKKN